MAQDWTLISLAAPRKSSDGDLAIATLESPIKLK